MDTKPTSPSSGKAGHSFRPPVAVAGFWLKPFQSFLILLCLGLLTQRAVAAAPVVSNVRASQRAGTGLVDIYYDVAAAAPVTVTVAVSTDSGVSYNAPAASLSGDLGSGVAPGNGKHVVWNAGADLAALYFPNVKVRVTADDAVAPSGMALIPAGMFTMGDTLDGESDALPLHSVYVSAFYMDKYDVTKALWDSVYQWATNHGYSFDNPGSGKAANHPVQTIYWDDAVKWCNARSEKENKTPAYYTDAGLSVRYKTGQVAPYVNWSVGYRLPTEAEWEKAARGGASGQRFPWGNTITWSQANYYAYPLSAGGYAYDVNPTEGFDPTFNDGVYPYTSPVGYFAPNGYGLYDMAGNVVQCCWDWYGLYSSGSQTDPRGPTTGSDRVLRGGYWGTVAFVCRSAVRGNNLYTDRSNGIGFRSVLPPGQ